MYIRISTQTTPVTVYKIFHYNKKINYDLRVSIIFDMVIKYIEGGILFYAEKFERGSIFYSFYG